MNALTCTLLALSAAPMEPAPGDSPQFEPTVPALATAADDADDLDVATVAALEGDVASQPLIPSITEMLALDWGLATIQAQPMFEQGIGLSARRALGPASPFRNPSSAALAPLLTSIDDPVGDAAPIEAPTTPINPIAPPTEPPQSVPVPEPAAAAIWLAALACVALRRRGARQKA